MYILVAVHVWVGTVAKNPGLVDVVRACVVSMDEACTLKLTVSRSS
jgi:hypothetical protein